MQAAAEVARIRPDLDMVMVGGGDVSVESFSLASAKTRSMAQFLCRNGIAEGRVAQLTSLPCTYHNIASILLANLQEHVWGEGPELRMLTSGYHRPRAEALAKQAWDDIVKFRPFPGIEWYGAEEVLGITEDDILEVCGDAYQRRLKLEESGMADIRNGTYVDSCFKNYPEAIGNALDTHGTKLVGPMELGVVYHKSVRLRDYMPL